LKKIEKSRTQFSKYFNPGYTHRVKVVISQGKIIYTKSGNIVKQSGKIRGNSQENQGKSELSHSQY